jgi:hypothetical protein
MYKNEPNKMIALVYLDDGRTTTMEAAKLYKQWKHLIGTEDTSSQKITEDRLLKWAETSGNLVCVFCCSTPITKNGFTYCQHCNEYKGIIPDMEDI